MIKRVICLILAAVMLLLSACSAQMPEDLKFYIIKREHINSAMSSSEIISTVKKNGRLMFDGTDIEGYNWQKHIVMLSEDSVTSLGSVTAKSGGSAIFKTDDSYAFAIMLGNELIYTGGFENGYGNPDVPLQPFIKDKTKTSFTIEYDAKYASGADTRTNSKLYDFLKDCGLLSSKTA